MNAPLVPLIDGPSEEDDMEMIRRELAALRMQLNRIERTMKRTNQ